MVYQLISTKQVIMKNCPYHCYHLYLMSKTWQLMFVFCYLMKTNMQLSYQSAHKFFTIFWHTLVYLLTVRLVYKNIVQTFY